MYNSEGYKLTTNPLSATNNGFRSDTRSRITTFFGDFTSEMKTIMSSLLDETKDLEVSGYKIPADQKTGAAATYLLENWKEEQSYVLGALLDGYKIEFDLAKKLDNFIAST